MSSSADGIAGSSGSTGGGIGGGIVGGGARLLPSDPPGGRKAIAVWGIGVAVYFVAITYRTSLGVAGLDAAHRFHINASALSTFSILQLLVYAGMQIPVGLLVDRLGAKKVLALGVVLYTAGQFGFAFSDAYGMALGSRALLGCGDAMTFISVLRLGARWFPARRGPMIAQIAALVGMAGNLISTLVLARLLHTFGWTTTFAGSALGGIAVLALLLLFLKDHPEGSPRRPRPASTAVRRSSAGRSRTPGASPAPGWACGCTSPPSSRRWSSCCCGDCRSSWRHRASPAVWPVNC
ncbi:MFS transporter [Streptomyces noursei]|nr:MFS transporter [Streptomyces noursei]